MTDDQQPELRWAPLPPKPRNRGRIWLIVGLVVVDMPKKAVAAAAIFSTGVVALSLPTLFPWIFIRALGLILLGYICGGRAFAHLGVPPIFIGELTLALGLLAALTTPQRWTALRSPIGKLYLLFAAWCAVRADNIDLDFVSDHYVTNTGVVVVDGSIADGWTVTSWLGQSVSEAAARGVTEDHSPASEDLDD